MLWQFGMKSFKNNHHYFLTNGEQLITLIKSPMLYRSLLEIFREETIHFNCKSFIENQLNNVKVDLILNSLPDWALNLYLSLLTAHFYDDYTYHYTDALSHR